MQAEQKRYTLVHYGLSLLCLCMIWDLAARLMHAPLILPSPADVFKTVFVLSGDRIFWSNIAATFIRCLLSFFISLVLGTLAGIICGISVFMRNFLSVPLSAIRSTPVVSFILLALFWFDSSSVPVFVSVLMTLPVMVTSVISGFTERNSRLSAMASLYGFSRFQRFRWITMPAVLPFFLTGAVSCFGLTWKVVAAGEVLCLPKLGSGTLLQTAQVHLETGQVMAVTLVLVVLSFVLEKLFAFAVFHKFHRGESAGEIL